MKDTKALAKDLVQTLDPEIKKCWRCGRKRHKSKMDHHNTAPECIDFRDCLRKTYGKEKVDAALCRKKRECPNKK